MDAATARAACREAVPGAAVRSLTPRRGGNVKRTYAATLDHGERRDRVVVQLQVDADRLRAEATLLELVADRTDVPVPPVRGVGRVDGTGYLVTGFVGGVDLHEAFVALPPAEQQSVARAFGRTLGVLHEAFPFEGFGRLVERDGSLAVSGPTTDWPAYLTQRVESGLDRLAPPLADLAGPVREAVAGARADGTLPASPPATLHPWDFRPGNALYDRKAGAVTAFLDWGDPQSAAAEFSLAKAEYLVVDWYVVDDGQVEALRGAFHDGYRSATTIDPGYWAERRRLYRMGAVVLSAMDSQGAVTRPRYPMVPTAAAVAFHRERVEELL